MSRDMDVTVKLQQAAQCHQTNPGIWPTALLHEARLEIIALREKLQLQEQPA